ncbi:MAG: carboxymuconolactone decarboxylase family protein [Hyphomicrobiales bacterium]
MQTRFVATAFAAILICFVPTDAPRAQEAPQFMQDVLPEQAVEPAWQEFQAIMNPDGALDGKTKELIGLAVAAQVPCEYCVYYHTKAAEQQGASEEEIKEALASGAMVRKWSTMLNGSDYDQQDWRDQVDAMFSGE